MAFRGENELWIGTVLSSLPDTISVANLAGVCGAMSSDANRAVNAYYGPSEELDTILASFVPDLEDIADLQYASRIDNAPLSLSQDLAALLEQWASGVSWSQIRGDTSLQEGDIARVFKRTAELLAQIPRAPHVSEQLKKTAKEAERIVNRHQLVICCRIGNRLKLIKIVGYARLFGRCFVTSIRLLFRQPCPVRQSQLHSIAILMHRDYPPTASRFSPLELE